MTEPRPGHVLIADDEPLYLRTTADLLRKAGYQCTTATNGQEALKALETGMIDVLLSDLNMPGNQNLELLHEQRRRWKSVPLIVVTGAPSLPTAIESLRLGIVDYLLKPVRFQELLSCLQRVLSNETSASSDPRLTSSVPSGASECTDPFDDIIGDSEPIRALKLTLQKIASSDASVLITGESGTGKEVVAHAIHRTSRRKAGRFRVIDCTAIPESLFESMLFGHVRGAFTSAIRDQDGLLQSAHHGTAFLDEIGELPASMQAKLLRVIQEQTFVPVGRTEPIRVDTRFISATNRDLSREVDQGRFRRDLFYRLGVIHLELPPLRERGDDVLLLARHFIRKLSPAGQAVRELDPEAEQRLRDYHWPGNVRELRNAIERGLALSSGPYITAGDLPASLVQPAAGLVAVSERVPAQVPREPAPVSRDEALSDAERSYLISLLKSQRGNVARSAIQAGLSRQGLHKLLRKHALDPENYRPGRHSDATVPTRIDTPAGPIPAIGQTPTESSGPG